MGIIDTVQGMQGDIVAQTDSVFTQMQDVYNGAMSKALADIDVPLSVNTNISEPGAPTEPMSLAAALAYIDALKTALLRRPTYPTYSYNAPSLPAISTNPPDLSTVTIPDAPNLLFPSFTATLEDEDVEQPTVTFDYAEIAYASGLHDALYDLLLAEISTGGYGINADDESRLFERAREREQRALQANVDGALRLFSAGGFSMPTGGASAAIQRAQSEAIEKVSSVNRDIMVERSKIYLEGKKQNQEHTLSIEKMDSDLHNAKQDRALKVAAQRITSVLEVAAFQVERLKLFMEKYKTLAYVFEVQVKAGSAKVDIYKVQIDAAKAGIELNMALLEEFTTRNKAIVDVFLAQVEEYKARIDGYSKYIAALSDQYKADATAFAAAADGYGRVFDMEAKFYGSKTDYVSAVLQARTAEEKMVLEEAIAKAQIDLDGAKSEVNAAAAVVSAALSAMNINATVSAQAEAGISYNGSVSEDNDVLTSYNYNGQL